MKLCKYGITLNRLREDDIELVRQKRNSPGIRKFMNYREHITPEMQKEWFHEIDNINNFYFVIEYKNEKIGLVNDKNINWEKKTAESGLFIWDKKYLNSALPFLASMLMFEAAYLFLDWHSAFIKVRKDNKKAISYNKSLGYITTEDLPDCDYIKMEMTREVFAGSYEKLKKSLSHFPESEKIKLVFEPHDKNNGVLEHIENMIKLLPPEKLSHSVEIKYIK